MTIARNLPLATRRGLIRLAESSDRASPTVFAGREDEFGLLDSAVRGVRRKESGHTVVIQGVPGAGKTALLHEYAARLLAANDDMEKPTIPVPLQPDVLGEQPVAIVQEIDRRFREFEDSDEWKRMANRALDGASVVAKSLFSAFTRRNFDDFRASARSPNSLAVALDDYVEFRFDRRDSAVVLLVDEAQNLNDTALTRAHLGWLHNSKPGRTQALLGCFGLANTTARLRQLGLSRLASRHTRSIGALSDEDAKRTVTGTLEIALADFTFDEVQRARWIGAAAGAILSESGNFPHHLANGCRALAEAVLNEGLHDVPPVEKLRSLCRECKREYYVARLQPWEDHTIALAHAFAGEKEGWTPIDDVMSALMASDNAGRPVNEDAAATVIEGMRDGGFVEWNMDVCRPILPSLALHFAEQRQALMNNGKAVQAIRAAMSDSARERQ